MRFLIENNYYILPDECQYTLAKWKGKDDRGADRYDYLSYHSTPERALEAYIRLAQKKAIMDAPEGDLSDLVRIMKEETDRLESIVKSAFKAITEWQEEE